jgi:hypothetical protein
MMAKRRMLRHACTSFDEAAARESCLHLINFALVVKGVQLRGCGIARSYERARLK